MVCMQSGLRRLVRTCTLTQQWRTRTHPTHHARLRVRVVLAVPLLDAEGGHNMFTASGKST